jgi:hypothetical protein
MSRKKKKQRTKTFGSTPPERSTVKGSVDIRLLIRAHDGDACAQAALDQISERERMN